MKKIFRNYIVLSVMLILIALIVGNCGGGDDTGAVPDVSGNSTQTQNLVTKDVSGFVYATSSLSASKDGEEEETVFSILDIPLSGEEGFIAQVNEYIQEDTSSKGSSPETEELLVAFTEEAGQYQPLPVWNSAANIYSSYADSLSTSPVPITSEGEISGSVLVDASDDLVSLDIEVSGEECYETETISSSDLLDSSDASGEYVLKSCPKKIIIKPGGCEIFSVFAKPSTNLSELGLQFSLVNPELGTVCGPIFLRCNGAKKYSVVYGVIYVKKNVSTPVDTAINVSTSQGKSLILPVQIVKKTAVVSGKVYASGPIVKGFVISQGPKSQCKINADGTYSLPKVWQGTGRKKTATWWIMNGDKKVRYRETKFVDVLGDVTVDFGVVPTPTPFPPPTDTYYRRIASKVFQKKVAWEGELGAEMGTTKTVDWLNKQLPEEPLPEDISEAIEKAVIYEPDTIKLVYKSGLKFLILGNSQFHYFEDSPPPTSEDLNAAGMSGGDPTPIPGPEFDPNATTVKNNEVLLLGCLCEDVSNNDKIFYDLKAKFESKGFEVTSLFAGRGEKLSHDLYDDENGKYEFNSNIIPGATDFVRPQDFMNLDQYGTIYINTHGITLPKKGSEDPWATEMYLQACPYYKSNGTVDEQLAEFLNTEGYKDHYYALCMQPFVPPSFWDSWIYGAQPCNYITVLLTEEFIDDFINTKDFSGSLVFLSACTSWNMHTKSDLLAFSNAKVFLGYEGVTELAKVQLFSYRFFYNMLEKIPPANVRGAYNEVAPLTLNPLIPYIGGLQIDTGPSYENDPTYLPDEAIVIIYK